MSEIQFQNDIEKLIEILPLRIRRNIQEGLLDEAIEIVLDIGRIHEKNYIIGFMLVGG